MKRSEIVKYKYLLEGSINRASILIWCDSEEMLKQEVIKLLDKEPLDRIIIWNSKKYYSSSGSWFNAETTTATPTPGIDKIIGYFSFNNGYYIKVMPVEKNCFVHDDINNFTPLKEVYNYILSY